MTGPTTVTAIVAALWIALWIALVEAVSAQPSERVIVPDVPGGTASVRGCYEADRTLYGPYRLAFCLERPGTYRVRGAGVRCDGRLEWSTSGKYVKVRLLRQSCNKRVAWAEGRLTCRPRSALDVILDALLKSQSQGGSGRVIVPDAPAVKVLKCTYLPTVPGERPASFFVRRQ